MNKCFGKILVFNVFFLSVLLFSGCGKITTESFEGIWIASHNTLNGNIYTGDLNLSVTEDGGFVLENSFKTVLMEGSLSVADDSILEISCEGENFMPPVCWDVGEKINMAFAL